MMVDLKKYFKKFMKKNLKKNLMKINITYEHRLIDDMVGVCNKMEWKLYMGL